MTIVRDFSRFCFRRYAGAELKLGRNKKKLWTCVDIYPTVRMFSRGNCFRSTDGFLVCVRRYTRRWQTDCWRCAKANTCAPQIAESERERAARADGYRRAWKAFAARMKKWTRSPCVYLHANDRTRWTITIIIIVSLDLKRTPAQRRIKRERFREMHGMSDQTENRNRRPMHTSESLARRDAEMLSPWRIFFGRLPPRYRLRNKLGFGCSRPIFAARCVRRGNYLLRLRISIKYAAINLLNNICWEKMFSRFSAPNGKICVSVSEMPAISSRADAIITRQPFDWGKEVFRCIVLLHNVVVVHLYASPAIGTIASCCAKRIIP